MQKQLRWFGLSQVELTGKAWDWFFLSRNKGCWVIVEFVDGTLVGGEFGESSFASLSPHKEDLYLESCYHVDENYDFLDPIPGNVGVWVNGSDVKKLHFFRADEGGGDGTT